MRNQVFKSIAFAVVAGVISSLIVRKMTAPKTDARKHGVTA